MVEGERGDPATFGTSDEARAQGWQGQERFVSLYFDALRTLTTHIYALIPQPIVFLGSFCFERYPVLDNRGNTPQPDRADENPEADPQEKAVIVFV